MANVATLVIERYSKLIGPNISVRCSTFPTPIFGATHILCISIRYCLFNRAHICLSYQSENSSLKSIRESAFNVSAVIYC